MVRTLLLFCLLIIQYPLLAQSGSYDTGGTLSSEQASYDVSYYDLNLTVKPDEQLISGSLTVLAHVVHPMNYLVLDLDTLLQISSIEEINNSTGRKLSFTHTKGKIWIHMGTTMQKGSTVNVKIDYGGKPRVAPRPPWQGGFQWSSTPKGEHWIATSCQGEGADVWWPVKDHVSDEPDSMRLSIRVPENLYVASNGSLENIEAHDDGTSSYQWLISNPINSYNVALNIAPYRLIESNFLSVAGDEFPVVFYVLPEDYEKGKIAFKEFIEHLQFFESLLGPYPFRSEKYGIAQTPHLGMEHQTIIAYGANFNNAAMTGFDGGFDALHQHELAHEWWGNLVTNADWKDMWIHEGFGSYMQPLYVEEKFGKEAYHAYMSRMRRFSNELPIAPRKSTSGKDIYRAPIYSKGAWFLHTLRYIMGDRDFFKALRRMAYPSEEWEKRTDGSQTRFVNTDDFLILCESISGKELHCVFENYLRQAKLPVLNSKIVGNQIEIKWEYPLPCNYNIPVEIEMDGLITKYEVPEAGIIIDFEEGTKPVVDPNNWLLFEYPKH